MSQLIERPTERSPVRPEAQPIVERREGTGGASVLRMLGAAALLVVGGVHLDQYVAVHFSVIPVIGPLFLLNFIGAVAVAAGLLLPLRRLHGLLALGGIAIGVVSIAFLEVSHYRTLFGFEDYGYRVAIVVALAAEAAAAVLLAAYLAARRSR